MSYNRVGKPSFFVDATNWMLGCGAIDYTDITLDSGTIDTGTVYELFDMNPQNAVTFDSSGSGTDIEVTVDFGSTDVFVDHVTILNHNLYASGAKVWIDWDTAAGQMVDGTAIIGCTVTSGAPGYASPTATGKDMIFVISVPLAAPDFTIHIEPTGGTFTDDIQIGAILFGSNYTMPQNADIGTPLGFEYPVNVREAISGKRFSNVAWVGGQVNGYAPFRGTDLNRASGRMVRDFSFNYIADTWLLPSDLADVGETTFFDQVWARTLGGHIPCILQMSNGSTTLGDYTFGRIRNLTQMTETAYNVKSIGFRFEEEF